MPTLTILNLNEGDTQQDLVNKINQNFTSIVLNGGGPQGPDGPQGDQGPIGSQGPKGDQGVEGERGTRWFISSSAPLGGTAGVGILPGDYWVDTSSNKEVFIYDSTGWVSTGESLQADDVFATLTGIIGPGSVTTKNAIVQSSFTPGNNTFVFSDATVSTTSANPTYSKFLISTDSTNGFPILEFAKSNLATGLASDYNRHPFFTWKNSSGTDYGLKFIVPGDDLDFICGGNLNLQSTAGNINFTGKTLDLRATSYLTFSSSGSLTINAGSSNLLISSNQFNLSSSSAFFSVPVSISGSFNGTSMLSLSNSSTGGGILVNLTGSASTSRYLANFSVSGSSKFYVRSDGKVKFDKTNYAYSTYTSSSPNYIVSTRSYYNLGSNVITNGNKVIVNLTGGSTGPGVSIPLNSGSTGLSDYIAIGECYPINIYSSSSTNQITGISITTNGTSSVSSAAFTSTPVVNVNVIKLSSSNWLVYYNTPSVSGIMSI